MNDKIQDTLHVEGNDYTFFSLPKAKKQGLKNIDKLPRSLKILLENLLRNQGDSTWEDAKALDSWVESGQSKREISFYPARVLMQDFTGVPAVVDLAAMREAITTLGGDPEKINPLTPVDLVIDHSVNVDHFGNENAFEKNVQMEYERNRERYTFLKWGQNAFKNFRVVPPGTGIIHQVNLEYLARVVWVNEKTVYPDTLVGTDSHTTMAGGLAVLGWGVGGIEAEAAMLGQPISMLIPQVVGFKITGQLEEGVTATDLVLTIVKILRDHGVVGKFVEFFGEGLSHLSLADRATISNMAPEYGATCGFFPVDQETLKYLELSGRSWETIALVEAYAKKQGLWMNQDDPVFSHVLTLDLKTIRPCLAGPKRPQDKIELHNMADSFKKDLGTLFKKNHSTKEHPVEGENFNLKNGDVVLAAITSCTNTSNPSVLIGAGLLAKKAVEKGLRRQPWIKTSFAPGSQVVTDYLLESKLQPYLNDLGFHLVGYGCTTCIGNSGPLNPSISKCIEKNDLVVASVLSGNRNFEGRINPDVRTNYLASPPLVVAYSLAGNMTIDISRNPLGEDAAGQPVFLKDIWPSNEEISQIINDHLSSKLYQTRYGSVFSGDKRWQGVTVSKERIYNWEKTSTYIQKPSFFDNILEGKQKDFSLNNAHILALLGDSVTTDHISPAGPIAADSPAGLYLKSKGVQKTDFNSYGSRRGNHEIMVRGTFANIRIKNEMVDKTGGYTRHIPSKKILSIYDAAMEYNKARISLIVIGGKEYGTGSSRDWAAKGVTLLGVRAVIAESFERIHRSNLIGMGVMPLQFKKGEGRKSLKLNGTEKISLEAQGQMAPGMKFSMTIDSKNRQKTDLLCRIDTIDELNYFKSGGILQYVLHNLKRFS